jgi:transposase
VKVAKLIQSHLTNVLSYFKQRITNAVAEGLNSKIATIQKRAYGFRNFEHFQIAIYFHCGGLGLWPSRATHTEV